MAHVPTPRTSSLHRTTSSAPGYFEYVPSVNSDAATIKFAMAAAHVHTLEAFHEPQAKYTMPENACIYARRALPALPPVKTQTERPSSDSLQPTRCSSLQIQRETAAIDSYDHSLPSAPMTSTCRGHERVPSLDSIASSKTSSTYGIETVPIRRPRQMRSISFRNFLNRNTYPSSATTETTRSSSSMSQSSDYSSQISCNDSVIDEPGLSLSKCTTPTSSAPGSRRPSTLSLASLRTSRKVSQDGAPGLPRLTTTRKHSTSSANASALGSGRKWTFFGGSENKSTAEDDELVSPNAPITPVTELSCVRCYYFSARNCNGWIMGGAHGEACDACTVC